jgi:ureidoglycolate lyase
VSTVRAVAPDMAAFAPFGAFIDAPAQVGERRFYSEWLAPVPARQLQVHTNRVRPAMLPLRVERVERHPHAAQAFVPLDTGPYLVTVMPSRPDGSPDHAAARAFVVPPTLGVVYRPGVWHSGIVALDRQATFVVLMWRGAADDDVFADVPPLLVQA